MTEEYRKKAEQPLSFEGWEVGKLGLDKVEILQVGTVNNFHFMRVYPSFYKDTVIDVLQGMDRDAPYVNWSGFEWKATRVSDLPPEDGVERRSSIPNKLLVELYMKEMILDEKTEGGAYYTYKNKAEQREIIKRIIPAFERRLAEALEERGLVKKPGEDDMLVSVKRPEKVRSYGAKTETGKTTALKTT